CVLRFHYSMEGTEADLLELIVAKVRLGVGVNVVWSRSLRLKMFNFIRQDVVIRDQNTEDFHFEISANIINTKGKHHAYIAIDDVSFTPDCIVSLEDGSA